MAMMLAALPGPVGRSVLAVCGNCSESGPSEGLDGWCLRGWNDMGVWKISHECCWPS
jgi:hypothetical protein